ncbi:hypothetical protein GCM10010954_16560 [Halobacillus andaensis]|uniref:Uncharacterized protein n=1 Tax=Halobacillus andaensis TaxID=1176239 RepID=A0A917B360_HALAA|nr:hypothetical protein GCM10010954_16560 [Halobacillus andaensis]
MCPFYSYLPLINDLYVYVNNEFQILSIISKMSLSQSCTYLEDLKSTESQYVNSYYDSANKFADFTN